MNRRNETAQTQGHTGLTRHDQRIARPFYCQWDVAGIVTRAPHHPAFEEPRSARPDPAQPMHAWATRWLLRWGRAGGRALIDAAGRLQLDHRPPLHMSARRREETAPAIAASLTAELQGTVGGRRAVARLVASRQVNADAVCRSDPDTAAIVAARVWLDAYRDAGGSWIGTDERPQLFIPAGSQQAVLQRMQDELFADDRLAHKVRIQIVREWWEADALPASEVEGC